MIRDIFREVPGGYPVRNTLEGINGYTQEGDDFLMIQVFPHHGQLVESLWVPSTLKQWGTRHPKSTCLAFC